MSMSLPLDYLPATDLLHEQVILITGAGDGIGSAVARCLAKHGASVVLLGRTVKKLEAVYDSIEAAGGPTPAIFPMDLLRATPDDTARLGEGIHKTFGRLDGVLHNASVLGQMAMLAHYEPQTWLEVMQVNVNASFLLTTTLMPLLERAEDARVIFTSAGVGRQGRAHWGAYSVSKFATEGMMQILAQETQSAGRIKVMSINPGATRTQMRAAAFPAEDPNTLRTAEQIAPAYLYLFGPLGSALHGQTLDAQ
jgi:NAD(P)-dependent dehydrogenase (short-subunit alcohol dehydrogenase family)